MFYTDYSRFRTSYLQIKLETTFFFIKRPGVTTDSILHHGHHPPWIGRCFRRSLLGVLCTLLSSAGKQSTKVNWPLACGLFLLYPGSCSIVRPYADSSQLSQINKYKQIFHLSINGTSLKDSIFQKISKLHKWFENLNDFAE